MASAASAAVSFAWPYTSCSVPSICLALPGTCVFTSPVARPNPSSTCPPTFLAVPPRRSSFMGVVLLTFEGKPAAAGIRSSPDQPEPCPHRFCRHAARANGRRPSCSSLPLCGLLRPDPSIPTLPPRPTRARSRARHAPPPAARPPDLSPTRTQFRVDPTRLSARGERHLGPFNSSAPRLQTANDCDDRDQQEYPGEYRRCDQRPVAFGEPNERNQQDESRGQNPAYESNEPAREQAGAQTGLCLGLQRQVFAQVAHHASAFPLAGPHRAEHKAKCQCQRQCCVRAPFQRFVDRDCNVVANFADSLNRFASFVLRVPNNTSHVAACCHD